MSNLTRFGSVRSWSKWTTERCRTSLNADLSLAETNYSISCGHGWGTSLQDSSIAALRGSCLCAAIDQCLLADKRVRSLIEIKLCEEADGDPEVIKANDEAFESLWIVLQTLKPYRSFTSTTTREFYRHDMHSLKPSLPIEKGVFCKAPVSVDPGYGKWITQSHTLLYRLFFTYCLCCVSISFRLQC